MSYYRKLGLIREPFSNSPDPMFLYDSPQHLFCLQQLEISARLKRGLNVIIGDIGTGKTTLCRRFVANLDESDIDVHLILDPSFKTPTALLRVLYSMLTGQSAAKNTSPWELKELVKKHLFHRGVHENTLTVLAIDEGQKLKPHCLEVLRELLNYETNAEKLVQIVIFAQSELEPVMQHMPNFVDRINFFCRLTPLSLRETVRLIRHRIKVASPNTSLCKELFTFGACYRIYRASRGYPRRIVRLCHKVILGLLIADRQWASSRFVARCIREEQGRRSRWAYLAPLVAGAILSSLAFILLSTAPFGSFSTNKSRVDSSTNKSFLRRAVADFSSVEAVVKATSRLEPTRPAYAMDTIQAAPYIDEQSFDSRNLAPILVVDEPALPAAGGTPSPAQLGVVRISLGETLSSMIKNVYGIFDQDNLKAVAMANPQIAKINDVEVGTPVVFPTIRAQSLHRVLFFNHHLTWVELTSTPQLGEAFAALRQCEYFDYPARILPMWSAAAGLRFSIVMEMPYTKKTTAQATLEQLPAPLRSRARVVTFTERNEQFLGQLNRATRQLAQGQP